MPMAVGSRPRNAHQFSDRLCAVPGSANPSDMSREHDVSVHRYRGRESVTESEQIRAAEEIGAKAREFYLKITEDKELQDRFQTEPLAALAAHGLAVPEAHQAEFMTVHGKSLAANERLGCKICKTTLYYLIAMVGVAAIAALASAVATFFNVTVAVVKPVLEAALATATTAAALAPVLCQSAVLGGPCAS